MSEAWWYFWNVCFAAASLCFALIAAVVLFRGVGDLRRMIAYLTNRR